MPMFLIVVGLFLLLGAEQVNRTAARPRVPSRVVRTFCTVTGALMALFGVVMLMGAAT